jgi:tRNA(fMet)-specific endonuclease VapC
MVKRYLLDTNALSEVIRPTPSAAFLRRFRAHETELAIASVTWHEALYGMARLPEGKRRNTINDYLREVVLATMAVIPYDHAAAEWHARERARLGKKGRSIPYADGQIAAVAAVGSFTLVTANVRDFEAFEGVRVVDWTR